MLYLEIKSLHILLVTIWFAGLFCLPRIFVNLAMVPADSIAERDRQLLMAGKLYRFMTPIGYLALIRPLAVARCRHLRAVDARQTLAGRRSRRLQPLLPQAAA